MLSDQHSAAPPPGRFWRFEAERPLLTNLIFAVLGGALFWLSFGWLSSLVWCITAVLLGTLAWRPGGGRRRRYEARVAASRAEVNGTGHDNLHGLPPLQADTSLAVLTAVLSFLGAGWVILLLVLHLAIGGSLTWGIGDLRGSGLGVGMAALVLLLVLAGLLCIKRRHIGLVLALATAIVGTVASGVGLTSGGGAGPLPAAHWWVFLAAALAAFAVNMRQAPDS